MDLDKLSNRKYSNGVYIFNDIDRKDNVQNAK